MARPHNYPKPNLSHLSTRKIRLPQTRMNLEFDLLAWMADVVRHTKNPPTIGVHRETELLATAQNSIDVLMQMPTGMALRASGGTQVVHAHFDWGRLPDGHWYVRAVSFGLNATQAELQRARQRALKQKLLDQAEAENARHVNLRKVAFPAEDHVDTWHHDVTLGDQIIGFAIQRAYEHASKDAKTLENPVGPVDMALDLVGAGVEHLSGPEIHGAGNLEKMGEEAGVKFAKDPLAGAKSWAKGYKGADYSRTGLGVRDRMRNAEKSTGDKILENALDAAAYVPGAGPFIRTIAGMMFDIAIASDAARITKIRSRAYVYFVAGYIHTLTLSDTGAPAKGFDKTYFHLGETAAPGPNSPGSFRAQVSLMHYASEHYTDGGWGGLGYRPESWTYPDQYIVKWNPLLLGRALATQLHTQKYLIE